MRNQLIALLLPLAFTAKAFSVPAGSACNWVDQEALAALGLTNFTPKEARLEIDSQYPDQCIIKPPNAPTPYLSVSVKPAKSDFVLNPICSWQPPPATNIELGVCVMITRDAIASFAFVVPESSMPAIHSTFNAQIERLFKTYLEAAPE